MTRLTALLVAFALASVAGPAAAAMKVFLEVDGKFGSETMVESLEMRSGKTARGEVAMEELQLSIEAFEPAALELMKLDASGRSFQLELGIPLEDSATGREVYYYVELLPVRVISYSISESGAADVTLGYTEVEWTYTTLDP